MIKPNDLRLGNWFANRQGGFQQLEIVHLDYLVNHPEPSKSAINAIPLTPEILVNNCGFWYSGLTEGRPTYDHVSEFQIWIDGTDCIFFFEESTESRVVIIGLHHLQNIFHALTGQELEITGL